MAWDGEVVWLGDECGLAVGSGVTVSGEVVFETAAGEVSARILKALGPEMPLEGALVWLVQKLAPGQVVGVGEPVLLDEYVLMVDDPYWGRRVQPAAFVEAPVMETFVMGWRVKGRILRDGVPVEGAKVSLEGLVEDAEGRQTVFWDSLDYNSLRWSEELETWVEGAEVLAPIMTDAEGRWSFVCPKGEGAMYQRVGDRRDEAEAGETPAPRVRLVKLSAVYLGRKVELAEEVEAVIDVLSGKLEVRGEPGAMVRVGTMDEWGEAYAVPGDGLVVVEGLPSGEHSVVQYRLDAYGWDASWGCARRVVAVAEGATAAVDMGLMEYWDPGGNMMAGRVYERMGVPAAGVAIVPINFESGVVGDAVTATDGGGYWEAEIPEEGFGGDLWIYDGKWGCVPLLGYPYSDVVLGARAYAGWQEIYKPEAWRKPDRGHANFQYVQEGIWVEDNETGQRYGTGEVEYGGWVTEETLPKFRFVGDVNELMVTGPQMREYSLHTTGRVLAAEFNLESQSFEEYETLPGHYRAAGYYPEYKFLIGGKVKGSAVVGDEERVGLEMPEAHRIGLEFGRHEWFTQVTVKEAARTCWTDLVCPYCGGSTWRDPSAYGYARGHCVQCAEAFGIGEAMDGRTHFSTPTVAGAAYRLTASAPGTSAPTRGYEFQRHWRPDLYDEAEEYLVQGGAGQATNAPRWFARHVNEVGDGLGFGQYDSSASPPFLAGHDLAYFGGLPEVQRDPGLAQVKMVFPAGYEQAEAATVEVDCRLADGAVETVRVTIPAGAKGPDEEQALSDVVKVGTAHKWEAEASESPYRGAGLYREVVGVRVVEPVGGTARFALVNDVPLLANAAGVPVEERKAALVALQIGGGSKVSGPHLLDDGVGQVFLFYAREGRIWMRRREGLPGAWQEALAVTQGPDDREPCAEKDEAGRLKVLWERAGSVLAARSADDGQQWVEV